MNITVMDQSPGRPGLHRSVSMETYMVRVYPGALRRLQDFVSIEALKNTHADHIVQAAVSKLRLMNHELYELAETFSSGGQIVKERRLEPDENPVKIQLLWPRVAGHIMDNAHRTHYHFFLRKKEVNRKAGAWFECSSPNPIDSFLSTFLQQPSSREYPDLCNLPDLNERTLLTNLQQRFTSGHIYTYVGSILIAVNPFKFFPIYNPKYVKMYQNRRLGELPPHIFALADTAYHSMLSERTNQCIVITGESGSGKTESTNLLLHHLSELSQKGYYATGLEQGILGAGPVLEAFGNAKTVHNNNSSRFGKFIQVNYKENGSVYGAIVEKYLLEKSRIVSQAINERNYHVFYYLLAGASETERENLSLTQPQDYHYLNQSECYELENLGTEEVVDEAHEFARLQQSMEMVGFSSDTQRRIFSVLSAVLHLGNIVFKKKLSQAHHEAVTISNREQVTVVSNLLKVREDTLIEALTKKKTMAGGETVVMSYKMQNAIATRDAMAKCLYAALFDWIVLQINHALLAKPREARAETQGNSIGVLDIFGFEDFQRNSFEQFCINYANEHLHYYFNQHIFKFEQEEYQREGIQWKNIEFIDNTGCVDLFATRPTGLLALLDEECNFPGANDRTLLSKFRSQHANNPSYIAPKLQNDTFCIVHYAGTVTYRIQDFREKNCDLVRQDIVVLLKNSSMAFVRELVGYDPVAVLRWAILRAFFRAYFAFKDAGRRHRRPSAGKKAGSVHRLSQGNIRTRSPHQSGDMSISEQVHRFELLQSSSWRGRSATFPSDWSSSDSKELRRAGRVVMRNKSFRPRGRSSKQLKDLQSMKTLAGKNLLGSRSSKSKSKPPSVSAQFNGSLQKLMESLNQSNPLFIRCIKSNQQKAACQFDEDLVLRQLRYTGMLATVKIRQAGYNVRLTFEEFIQSYRVLLPNGLLSSRNDIESFLHGLDLNRDNYQIGNTKVFLREAEKLLLDDALHSSIMLRVLCIQHWVRSQLCRRRFIRARNAAVVIQTFMRGCLAQRRMHELRLSFYAAIVIQRVFRGFRQRKLLRQRNRAAVLIQSCYRGYVARRWFKKICCEQQKNRHQDSVDLHSSTSDEGVLTKESSTEELIFENVPSRGLDSEGSSGILDDTDIDSCSLYKGRDCQSLSSLPSTPSSPFPVSPGGRALVGSAAMGRIREEGEELLLSPVPLQRKAQKSFSTSEMPSGSTVQLRTQPGPRDLEILIRPAINKASSEDFLTQQHHYRAESKRVYEKRISAPLAKQESFSEADLSWMAGNIVRRLPMADAEMSMHRRERPHSTDDKIDAGNQRGSPFYRAKKHFKHFMAGGKKIGKKDDEDSEESQSEDNSKGSSVSSLREAETKQKHRRKGSKKHRGSANRDSAHKLSVASSSSLQSQSSSPEASLSAAATWSLSGTSQWQYPTDILVSNPAELQQLDQLLFNKIVEFGNIRSRRETIFDVVFKGALREFHSDLITKVSIARPESFVELRYKDLMAGFEGVLKARAVQEGAGQAFPATVGINAFRGFLDDFHKRKENNELPEVKVKKAKKKKQKDTTIEILDHKFIVVQFSIATYCELCSSSIWMIEKGLVCHLCKYTIHKKCSTKISLPCKGSIINQESNTVIGAPLTSLIDGQQQVPAIIDMLLNTIENSGGLYTVGLYRKAGAAAKIRTLIKDINKDVSSVDFFNFPIHVLAAVVKTFLRELPDPIMTFELYDDFILATDVADEKERTQALYNVLHKLPLAHFALLERLMFHLAKVAQQETTNKMSCNGLAIIFAPSLLRTNQKLPAQESLSHIPKQTRCIQCILEEQLRKVQLTLADINTLDRATISAEDRLSVVRASIRQSSYVDDPEEEEEVCASRGDSELRLLSEQIQSLQDEKEELTLRLPQLECRLSSSDDDLLSTDEIDQSADELDFQEYALTFDLPGGWTGVSAKVASLPYKLN